MHLKKPSTLPSVSDYHVFKEGIRPVWEDEENKRGGKWIMRLKKGVVDSLLAGTADGILIGDWFAEAQGRSLWLCLKRKRSGEDVLSIWTKNDGGRNIKIRYVRAAAISLFILLTYASRETVKRVLDLPEGTNIVWRSHDDSIAQRSAIDQARYEKNQGHEKRRMTSMDES